MRVRKYFKVRIETKDGGDYIYRIYILNAEKAVAEAKHQLWSKYGYKEEDIDKIVCILDQ